MKQSLFFSIAASLLLLAGCSGNRAATPQNQDPVDQLQLKDYEPVSVFQLEEHKPTAAKFSVIDMHSHPYRDDEAGIRA